MIRVCDCVTRNEGLGLGWVRVTSLSNTQAEPLYAYTNCPDCKGTGVAGLEEFRRMLEDAGATDYAMQDQALQMLPNYGSEEPPA